jgi:hypothetical protein
MGSCLKYTIKGVFILITIRQPVTIKVVLTEDTKQAWLAELRRLVNSTIAELEELEFRSKQWLRDAEKQGEGAIQAAEVKIEQEKAQRIEQREQLIQQLTQIQQMDVGSEVANGTVETTVDVRVGDSWDAIVQGSEIVIKDGAVVEIRQNSQVMAD